ncbi:Uncharacterized protein OBRU01_21633 [Operophtera brumata]|uniref:Primase C-terminal 2 domain-containing protein n=1 Tax=Operophtera brumata TaxID=104452 RepID=A0A0L7KSV2_OPEBR|nr:Uncharacterized protein OBRU01_21633 [Operophtera brumata]
MIKPKNIIVTRYKKEEQANTSGPRPTSTCRHNETRVDANKKKKPLPDLMSVADHKMAVEFESRRSFHKEFDEQKKKCASLLASSELKDQEITKLKQSINDLKKNLNDLKNEQENKCASLIASSELKEQEITKLKQSINDLNNNLIDLENTNTELVEESNTSEKKITSLNKEKEKLKKRNTLLQSDIRKLKIQNEKMENLLQTARQSCKEIFNSKVRPNFVQENSNLITDVIKLYESCSHGDKTQHCPAIQYMNSVPEPITSPCHIEDIVSNDGPPPKKMKMDDSIIGIDKHYSESSLKALVMNLESRHSDKYDLWRKVLWALNQYGREKGYDTLQIADSFSKRSSKYKNLQDVKKTFECSDGTLSLPYLIENSKIYEEGLDKMTEYLSTILPPRYSPLKINYVDIRDRRRFRLNVNYADESHTLVIIPDLCVLGNEDGKKICFLEKRITSKNTELSSLCPRMNKVKLTKAELKYICMCNAIIRMRNITISRIENIDFPGLDSNLDLFVTNNKTVVTSSIPTIIRNIEKEDLAETTCGWSYNRELSKKHKDSVMSYFIKVMPRQAERDWFLSFVAKMLNGQKRNEFFLVLTHKRENKNGISTLMSLLATVFGNYFIANTKIVVAGASRSNNQYDGGICNLNGKRLLVADELHKTDTLNCDFAKAITGQSAYYIQDKKKYSRTPFKFLVQAGLIMSFAEDDVPKFDKNDQDFVKRMVAFPMRSRFLSEQEFIDLPSSDKIPSVHIADDSLKLQFPEWRSAVLDLLIKYLQHDNESLPPISDSMVVWAKRLCDANFDYYDWLNSHVRKAETYKEFITATDIMTIITKSPEDHNAREMAKLKIAMTDWAGKNGFRYKPRHVYPVDGLPQQFEVRPSSSDITNNKKAIAHQHVWCSPEEACYQVHAVRAAVLYRPRPDEYDLEEAHIILGAPFGFHYWNGIRFCAWNTGRWLSQKEVVETARKSWVAAAAVVLFFAIL